MQRVMDLLSLKEHQARTLLIHYRWDVDEVFEVLVEKGKDRLYAEACVMVQYDDNLSSTRRSSLALCEICMEEVPVFKMTTMDCGHWFCNNCWTQHFVVKINEGQSRRISCMAHKCYVVCDEDKIRYYVSKTDPDLAEQFDRYLLESYIEDNKRVKWCPSVPHCGNAIRIDSVLAALQKHILRVPVKCGSYGPRNAGMSLRPLTGSQSIQRIVPNVISQLKRMEDATFWLCGGATGFQHTWESIEGHTCGRFKEEDIANIARAESEIVRYTHYHGRFKAHSDSFKAEVALKEKLQKKISNMEARELEIKNYDWVTDGAERLLRSRRIISYSYPFAYYMFNDTSLSEEMTKEDRNIKQNLFEDHQQQLEGHIEKLSLFLEEPFDEYPEGKVMESRMQIITLSNITDVLCKRIYEYIDNEILLHLRTTINIVPYRSKGADKAVELEL
ncbi:Zinc finger, RING/FYVE/PHD-type [Cynara cardunculus var. scolymus]|uniref:RBR-type E3 ubiquitin transferase n=1 Tax=Cynara cardunculus var. scolymus TaxID=59895 RepID=A0A118JSA1_CYNCS|nr:Zinc finger, RING/FYVE/PHD-type [Cynara cardunculus var. scolymus]